MLAMPTTEAKWSSTEENIAQSAFDAAFHRETRSMVAEAKRQAELSATPEDLWALNDFLSARRHYLDGKYDFHHESLVFVLAQLAKEGWLELSELDGLSADKIAKIRVLTLM